MAEPDSKAWVLSGGLLRERAAWPPKDDQFSLDRLDECRVKHEQGKHYAARDALMICAGMNLRMPPWLANLVQDAIVKSNRGVVDDVFGFGNAKMLTKWRREDRAGFRYSTRTAKEAWQAAGIEGVNEGLAKNLHTSVKNIEKITRGVKKPYKPAKK